jgi:hypothetical protein
MGKLHRAICWIDEGSNAEGHASHWLTLGPLGLLHGAESTNLSDITAKKLFQLNGTNPHTMTFGTDADISNLCQFGWYKWVYFREDSTKFPFQKERLGQCLGPARNEGY